jgi:hypothetical protein
MTMWTPDDVKARFVEAVDIERRVMVKGMGRVGNGWPQYRFDQEDRAGWDDAAKIDDLEKWAGRKFTTSAEQSRWQEVVFEWRLLIPVARRDLMWDFAECRARGWSFSKYCEDRGLVRMTAYRRVDRVLENLARVFALENRSLRLAADRWVLQVEGPQGIGGVKVEDVAPKRNAKNHPSFRTEKHHDSLTTPEALAAFQKHVDDVNDARRKSRLRKALRGVPGEAEAA